MIKPPAVQPPFSTATNQAEDSGAAPQEQPRLPARPADLQRSVLEFLGARDRVKWLWVSRSAQALAVPLVAKDYSDYLTDTAENVGDYAAFQEQLHAIIDAQPNPLLPFKPLPDHLKLKPLHALGPRIVTLELWKQDEAREELLAAMNALSKDIRAQSTEHSAQAKSADLTTLAESVADLVGCQELLGSDANGKERRDTIASLRPDLQIKPLMALASRVALLPPGTDRDTAFADLFEVFEKIPEQFKERFPNWETDGSPQDLPEIVATYKVGSGASVTAIAQKYGITNAFQLNHLQAISVDGPAGDDVRKGKSVPETAQKYGITNALRLDRLQAISVHGPAGEDVRKGKPVPETAQKYGITNAFRLDRLKQIAVERHTASE
jgi:transposase-like protein